MTTTLTATVWMVGLFGATATLASIAVAAGLLLPWVARLHPRTRARLHAWSAVLPLAVAAVVVAAIFVPHPWLGLPDHCLAHAGHVHLCLACGLAPPPAALSVIAVVYGAWALLGVLRVSVTLARALHGLRPLERLEASSAGLSILTLETPTAFVAGFLRPRVFVSRSATGGAWSAVLAHERDHARHRDPLARLLARFALALHAPGVGAWLARRLVTMQELAADESAASQVGDRLEVARQLLAWTRAQRRTPLGALGFGEGDLTLRIRVLLDAPRYRRGPTRAQVAVAAALGALLVASLSTYIHHGAEEIVHLLEAAHVHA